jgi:pSer/pThr/pTyr-binding forkhead associated (FHA) protein
VILAVVRGSRAGDEYTFDGYGRCVVGREWCDICLPRSPGHLDVSRRHCEFEIEPPLLWVRDLGSLNGTFVNGEIIGRRTGDRPLGLDDSIDCPARELKDGDEVQVGQSVIRVSVRVKADRPAALVPLYFL